MPAPRRHELSESIRCAICNAVRYSLSGDDLEELAAGKSVTFQKGRHGDPRLAIAYQKYLQDARTMPESDEALNVSKKQFREVASRWMQRFNSMRERGVHTVHARKPRLTNAEYVEAAIILGTPVEYNDGIRHWHNAEECLCVHHDRQPRFKELMEKGGYKTAALFQKKLLAKCSDVIKTTHRDVREKLCERTRAARRQCSDVWGGASALNTMDYITRYLGIVLFWFAYT